MKTIKNSLVITCFFILFVFIACNKKSENREQQKFAANQQELPYPPELIEEICPDCVAYAFWLPEGSISEEAVKEDGSKAIVMTAPAGYHYYGFTKDSILLHPDSQKSSGGSVTVTCKCTKGDANKCSPIENGGTVTCAIEEGCTSCERQQTTSTSGTKPATGTKETANAEHTILSGGFANPDFGVRFASLSEDLPYAFEALLFYPEIWKEYENFMLQFYTSLEDIPDTESNEEQATAPKGYCFAVINVYGRALVVLLPEEKITEKSAGVIGTTYSCLCNEGTGKCKEKSKFGYHFCEKDGCSVCNTMVVSSSESSRNYTCFFY